MRIFAALAPFERLAAAYLEVLIRNGLGKCFFESEERFVPPI